LKFRLCYLFRSSLTGVYEEAKYFGIYELLPQLESIIEESNELPDERPLSRRDVINATVMTDSNRCDITLYEKEDFLTLRRN